MARRSTAVGTADVNINVSGNSATASTHSVSITGDANVSPSGNIASALVCTVSITGDASINALVVLHSRSLVASFSLDEKLDEIRAWFGLSANAEK